MTLLITGGAGYIGSVITEYCLNAGHTVVIIDDLREGNRESIPNGAAFVEADFANKPILEQIFSSHKIDTVIHLAASSSVPLSVLDPELYYLNNIAGSITLLEVMQKHGVNNILFSSSAAVYGEPQYFPVDEVHQCKPINPYGKSKLFLEEILIDHAVNNRLKFVAFRFFCAAGATDTNGESRFSETHLIPAVIDCILGIKESITVYGDSFSTPDGSGVRDYVHVADIAKAIALALDKIGRQYNTIYNIGSDSGYSVMEVIKTASRVFGKLVPYTIAPPRPGDPAILVASSRKIREQLGWKPTGDLEKILLSTYKWRNNPRY